MKKTAVAAVLVATGICFCFQNQASAGKETPEAAVAPAKPGLWTEDIEGAFKTAAESKKPLFVNFTGSDWCYWCKIADKNIFSTPEWKAFSGKMTCLKVDFPRMNRPDAEVMRRRMGFAKEFGVRGYPTFVLLDSDRKVRARFSAGRKNASEFISEVAAALEKQAR